MYTEGALENCIPNINNGYFCLWGGGKRLRVYPKNVLEEWWKQLKGECIIRQKRTKQKNPPRTEMWIQKRKGDPQLEITRMGSGYEERNTSTEEEQRCQNTP